VSGSPETTASRTHNVWRAVAGLIPGRMGVLLHELCEVHIPPEREPDGHDIRAVAVRGELDSPYETAGEVAHEPLGIFRRALPDAPRHDELGVGIERDPGVHVAGAEDLARVLWDVLGLRVAERPDLIALDAPAHEVPQGCALVGRADRAEVREQIKDGLLRYAGHTDSRPDRVSLDERPDNGYPLGKREPIHGETSRCYGLYSQGGVRGTIPLYWVQTRGAYQVHQRRRGARSGAQLARSQRSAPTAADSTLLRACESCSSPESPHSQAECGRFYISAVAAWVETRCHARYRART